VDAPEKPFTLPDAAVQVPDRRPDEDVFVNISDARWEAFLGDPFAAALPPFEPALGDGLRADLAARVGPGAASNHAMLADAAREALIGLITTDMQELGQTKDTFRFFLAFAHEVMDGYGRLLGSSTAHSRSRHGRGPTTSGY